MIFFNFLRIIFWFPLSVRFLLLKSLKILFYCGKNTVIIRWLSRWVTALQVVRTLFLCPRPRLFPPRPKHLEKSIVTHLSPQKLCSKHLITLRNIWFSAPSSQKIWSSLLQTTFRKFISSTRKEVRLATSWPLISSYKWARRALMHEVEQRQSERQSLEVDLFCLNGFES